MRRRLRGDRGSAATEVVLITPALLFLILIVIQFGLWYHAQHVAQAAADEGARAAKVEEGSAAGGIERANAFLDQTASNLIENRNVAGDRTAETATVTVSGQVAAVIPGFSLTVKATATGPVERFRPDANPGP
jgi:Flp pilus assembly protein TadG